MAISCCAAVGKLSFRRITNALPTFSIEDVMIELMNLAHSIVPVEKLHHLATEAGFESDFLSHFGKEVLSRKRSEELEFWIGLAQKKMSVEFRNFNVTRVGQTLHDKVSYSLTDRNLLTQGFKNI